MRTESELWEWMMEGNYPGFKAGSPNILLCTEHRTAIATLTRDIDLGTGFGSKRMKAGDKVKVVMASKYGDVGITSDLEAKTGYLHRTQCNPPMGLLKDFEPVIYKK